MNTIDAGDHALLVETIEQEDEERKEKESEKVKSLKHGVLREAYELYMCEFGCENKEQLRAGIAPGRVNLIGEHIDYCDGFVLPMAIPRFTVAIGKPAEDENREFCRVYSSHFKQTAEIPSRNVPKWATYIEGVLALHPIDYPLDILIHSTVPVGSGLSSSAAVELATLHLAIQFSEKPSPSSEECALLCQKAEHDFAHVPCGIMDQFVISLALPGHALKIDCRSLEYDRIPLAISQDVTFIVVDSGVRHNLGNSEYSKRKMVVDECLQRMGKDSWRDVSLETLAESCVNWSNDHINFSTHILSEISRTDEAASALLDNNITHFGRLMCDSHKSLRDLYRVSCKELDDLVEIAMNCEGVYGSRMTGGGFGGCTVNLVRNEQVKNFKEIVQEKYSGSAHFYETVPVGGSGPASLDFIWN